MQNTETSWRKNGDWKARYSKLYSSRGFSLTKKVEPQRISFMNNDTTPYTSLLIKLRASQRDTSIKSNDSLPPYLTSLMSQQSEIYGTKQNSQQSQSLGINDTLLLDMVRSRSREVEDELRDQPLMLTGDDNDNQNLNESCVHGMSIRMTERSASRSRVSRMSTRRDMDIPSILAFTTTMPAPPTHLEIPAFQKVEQRREEIPRWSIRRSVCPVCSQKWKDKSSITNVKYSGLKRNSLYYELPSVIAPARLRTLISMGHAPRPVPAAIDKETGVPHGGLRNTSTSWQLTRARRFRAPKPQLPPPEATAPPSCNAPMARKDLDLRVSRFLSDEFTFTNI
ncbi:uncharacterized protein LOC125069979 [Vanessa atalanta]|uniref:uncharacterized protein LOC125069979 n=1 Tax=Vanessa atalanta TaxID=42275 RepID=UPI001FCDB5CB|nr:uncharacterized protein LOC125069979 [Vanessa atalanta]